MMKYLPFVLCLIFGCQTKNNNKSLEDKIKSEIRYAERFDVEEVDGVKLISIDKPWHGNSKPIKYLLYEDSIPKTIENLSDYIQIKVPVQSIISNSTTHIALMEQLGVEHLLIGFAQTQYIYSRKFNDMLAMGELQEVGPDGQLDIESILDLAPDIVMAFSARNENRQLQKLEELGVTVVMNAGYMETSLLGRLEWLKFVGHLTGRSELANEIFDKMVINYDSLRSIALDVEKPIVLSGTLYGGNWFLPAGQNYGSKIVEDAAGDYLWKEDQSTGWLNLDFELVYEKAWNAEYWIGAANFNSLDEMKKADERYADFEAFKNGKVYTYGAKISEKGGNDYFESGNVNPDRLLADHIKILHPELLPDYELYYYRKLE